jgi:hypothetical protein
MVKWIAEKQEITQMQIEQIIYAVKQKSRFFCFLSLCGGGGFSCATRLFENRFLFWFLIVFQMLTRCGNRFFLHMPCIATNQAPA